MTAILARLVDLRFLRYLIASIGALAVDMGCFLLLLGAGMSAAAASALGYSLGIAVHWLLSSRTVFQDSVARDFVPRTRQKALFVVSALAGLGLTTAIVGLGSGVGVDPRLAKLAAVGASFLVTWLLRSKLIFRSGPN